jgi:radical SAM superfamily enzyme
VLRTTEEKLSGLKDNISIISMIVRHDHLEVRVVADEINGLPAEPVEPNLEDAYIYFMEIQTGMKLHEDEKLFQA